MALFRAMYETDDGIKRRKIIMNQFPPYRMADGAATLARTVLGTAGLGGVWGHENEADAIQAMLLAFDAGIHFADTAPLYQHAEVRLGKALAQWKGARISTSTKAGVLPGHKLNIDPVGLQESVKRSVERLGRSKFEILYLHEPENLAPEQRADVIKNFKNLLTAGYAAELGIGGGWGQNLDGLIDDGVFKHVLVFNRLDACCLDAYPSDVARIKKSGAKFWAASPLHMGVLTDQLEKRSASPSNYFPAKSFEAAGRSLEIARRHGMSLTTLAHRFVASCADADTIVIGPSTLKEAESTLNDLRRGSLAQEVFNEVCQSIRA